MTLILPAFPGITWPRDITWGNFDTTVQKSVSGKIAGSYPNIINPTRRYTISISGLDSSGNIPALTNNSLQALVALFFQCYGRALPFQYTDPEDTIATTQQFGTGDGASVAFQLTRTSSGFVESVFAPLAAPSIYVNGVLKTLTTDYTISNTGKVTFVVAPPLGQPITWTGTYAWWCHWDSDSLDTSEFLSNIHEAQKLSFTTRVF